MIVLPAAPARARSMVVSSIAFLVSNEVSLQL